jgi:hypothetical protein
MATYACLASYDIHPRVAVIIVLIGATCMRIVVAKGVAPNAPEMYLISILRERAQPKGSSRCHSRIPSAASATSAVYSLFT